VVPSSFVLLLRAEQTMAARFVARPALFTVSALHLVWVEMRPT
jgi:hypothetical protein